MALFLATKQLTSATQLSDQARLAATFVDGAAEWLQWAIPTADAVYHFADDGGLLAGIQDGLHGSGLTLLPRLGLLVGPVKLVSLAPADLQTLAATEAGEEKRGKGVAQVLAQNGLKTAADLASGAAWLAGTGVADQPLFQALSLTDRLALTALAEEAGDAADASEAAAFAAAQARTVAEFDDYVRIYRLLASAPGAPPAAAARAEAALVLVQRLLPLVFGALDCPSVDMPLPLESATAVVQRSVSDWQAAGRRIGFKRASMGVRLILESSGLGSEAAKESLVAAVSAGLNRVELALRGASGWQGVLAQDGEAWSFTAASAGGRLELAISAEGVVSLCSFAPTGTPVTAPAPA